MNSNKDTNKNANVKNQGKLKSLSILWFVWCCLMIFLNCQEAWTVYNQPQLYAALWGSEGPGASLWYYASPMRYVFNLVYGILWFFLGLLICIRNLSNKLILLLLHMGISALYFIILHVFFLN